MFCFWWKRKALQTLRGDDHQALADALSRARASAKSATRIAAASEAVADRGLTELIDMMSATKKAAAE